MRLKINMLALHALVGNWWLRELDGVKSLPLEIGTSKRYVGLLWSMSNEVKS